MTKRNDLIIAQMYISRQFTIRKSKITKFGMNHWSDVTSCEASHKRWYLTTFILITMKFNSGTVFMEENAIVQTNVLFNHCDFAWSGAHVWGERKERTKSKKMKRLLCYFSINANYKWVLFQEAIFKVRHKGVPAYPGPPKVHT